MLALNRAAIVCVLLVGACTTTTDQYGRTTLSTPTLGQLLGVGPRQTTSNSVSTTGSAGGEQARFVERLDGKTVNLTLMPVTGDEWLVHISMEMRQPLCLGDVRGRAIERSPGDLIMTRDVDGHDCNIEILRTPQGATVGEIGSLCMYDHGASCEFAASMTPTE